jgi:hypothetical protein
MLLFLNGNEAIMSDIYLTIKTGERQKYSLGI